MSTALLLVVLAGGLFLAFRFLKGFRTYAFVFLAGLETLVEPLIAGAGAVSWERLGLIAGFALLRTVTNTAPGAKE